MQRRFRLRRAADFELLRQNGRSWHHQLLVLIVSSNGNQISRFGFSASRRLGNATVRNRAKRLLREVVRLRLNEIQVGWDCLFIARQAVVDATYAEIDVAVQQLLRQASVLEVGIPSELSAVDR